MRRPFMMLLLGLGAIGGYASGFASLRHCRAQGGGWERRVAQVCVEAARSKGDRAVPAAPSDE